ncbi:thiamine pyrophosphate-dependent enzyme [Candidatus Pelagibacter sp. HIMB1493]|uniref:thiamine pyrophosphate-dependent enzyme n=1 Tax=Candidatus Pelagibacter sp. HIMB1493 TaxID=3413334 RepID=UPI003F826C62
MAGRKKNYLSKSTLLQSKKRCSDYRKRLLDLSLKVSALHIGGSFSSLEIMDCVNNILHKKRQDFKFILSKGHIAVMMYIILQSKKIISKNELYKYCTKKGKLGVHPTISTPGIEISSGSLGHGLGIASGMAYANIKNKKTFYVLISDGELQEGSTWESAITIGALNLKNVILIVDNNNLQSLENMSKSHPNLYPIENKFREFGWDAKTCNGHDTQEIYQKIIERKKNKPFALIAKTIKGYPISFMRNVPIWHYRSPTIEEYSKAIKELI